MARPYCDHCLDLLFVENGELACDCKGWVAEHCPDEQPEDDDETVAEMLME